MTKQTEKTTPITFEEACELLKFNSELPDVSSFPESLRKPMIAFYQLSIIYKAIALLSGGIAHYGAVAGPFCAITDSGASGTFTFIGARHLPKDRNTAIFFNKKFEDAYNEYILS